MFLSLIAVALLTPASPSLTSAGLDGGEILPNAMLANIVRQATKACSAEALDAAMSSKKDLASLRFSDLSIEQWNSAIAPRNWNEAQKQVARAVCEGYLAGYQAGSVDALPAQ